MTISKLSPKSTNHLPDGPSFRNVSACKRCRLRKHKCDQSLPRCKPCEKAQSRCVGYDPISKREVPRSYVYYLESRMKYLDSLLYRHKITTKPNISFDDFEGLLEEKRELSCLSESCGQLTNTTLPKVEQDDRSDQHLERENNLFDEAEHLGTPLNDPCFDSKMAAKVLPGKEISKILSGKLVRYEITKESEGSENEDTESIRTSLFSLLFDGHKAETFELPRQKKEAEELAEIYFDHINPYTPILRRDHFQRILDEIYAIPDRDMCPLKHYTAFIVFAIGAASGNLSSREQRATNHFASTGQKSQNLIHASNVPGWFKSSAMVYLESFLTSPRSLCHMRKLEELQALVLLCLYTLIKPNSPSLERLVNVAMRSATDLRLYSDSSSPSGPVYPYSKSDKPIDSFFSNACVIDLRRRLWWSIYSLERLIVPYLGRPFFIPDEVVTTQYPCIADDRLTNQYGTAEAHQKAASYLHATHHFMRLRSLQSEVHRMIQYLHAFSVGNDRPFQTSFEASQSLVRHEKFVAWRLGMTTKLDQWRKSIPHLVQTSIECCESTMELEYWQTMITLHRHNTVIPEGILSFLSSNAYSGKSKLMNESDEDTTTNYFELAEACRKTIQVYRQRKVLGLVNIPYISTNWIFIAGSLFLSSIWNSARVAQKMSFQDIDYTVLTTLALLGAMQDEYSPARALRTTFSQMSVKVVKHCLSINNRQEHENSHQWKSEDNSDVERSSREPDTPIMLSRIGSLPSPSIQKDHSDQNFMSPFSSIPEGQINTTPHQGLKICQLSGVANLSQGNEECIAFHETETLGSILPGSTSIKVSNLLSEDTSGHDILPNTWAYQSLEPDPEWPEIPTDMLDTFSLNALGTPDC